MTNVICIYHQVDLDGWLSAAIVLDKYPNAKLIPYNYGQAIPDIEPNADVIMCDVAFPMDKMDEIATKSNRFVWIDHHSSNLEKYEAYIKTKPVQWTTVLARQGELIGACELTWKHLMNKPMPLSVQLLGGYDCFRHKGTSWEKTAMYFQLAAQSIANSPETAQQFLTMTTSDVNDMVYEGQIIFNHKKMLAQETYRGGQAVTIYGKKFIVFNSDRFNPVNYDIDYIKDGYDGTGSYYYDGKIWHFSLYTTKEGVDCSAICKSMGGGGHKQACGFEPTTEKLMDILNNKYAYGTQG